MCAFKLNCMFVVYAFCSYKMWVGINAKVCLGNMWDIFRSSTFSGYSVDIGGAIYNMVVFPLRVLFFHGPKLRGFGFGGGSRPESMCQSFTDVRSEFWSVSEEARRECFEILEKKFRGFVVGTVALLTIVFFFQCMYLSVNRYFLLRPLNEVNRNLEKVISALNGCLLAPVVELHEEVDVKKKLN